MKTICRIFVIFMLLSISVTAIAQTVAPNVTIDVVIKNNRFNSASLYQMGQQNTILTQQQIDTTGKFTLLATIVKTDFFKLQLDQNNSIMMVLQPGEKIKITADGTDLASSIVIKGSPITEVVRQNERQLNRFKTQMDSLNNVYQMNIGSPKIDSLLKVLNVQYKALETKQAQFILDFMANNPSSLAILFLTDRLPVDENYDAYKKVDAALFAKYPDNIFVSSLHDKIQSTGLLFIGAVAPEINQPDTNGKMIALSSLRGNIVVIDFWASWCGPCRKENPNMVKLYAAFHSKGFEIFSVSLDKAKPAWVSAIKADKLTWTHVSDLKYWNSEAAKTYSVQSIPATFLLDREGKIVAKNLRGEDLYNKVQELINANQKK
ncbi:MAG: TlpA disulfide reductase family protein [Bacteroidota bacterium]